MTASKKHIFDLEKKFWAAMTSGDFKSQFELMTPSIVVSTDQGTLTLDHSQYKKTSEGWPIQIHSYELSNESVYFPRPDLAIVSYDVAQDVTAHGKRSKIVSHDTSTWVRVEDTWLCCAHTDVTTKKPPA